jgi:hypothetical protein
MKSTNGGTTWAPLAGAGLPTGNNRVISRLAIKPNNANILIAATSSGTYYQSVLAPQGCFADKKLILTINASTEASQTHSATYSYSWNGENYFCSGTYYHYSTNADGCPHTDILYLNIE